MESRGRRVHSIEKAIRLLDCFWEADSPLSLHELEQRTGWAKSTIHGLLATMLDSAVVEQNPTDGKYRLGYHLFELGSAVRQGWSVPELCRPHLRAMAARLGESVHLARLSGDELILVACEAPQRGFHMTSETGTRLPVHASSQGKAILSAMPVYEAEALLRRRPLQVCTPHTVTAPEQLLAQLPAIRRGGYAEEHEEYRLGLKSVAAPIYEGDGPCRYAIGVICIAGTPAAEFASMRAAVMETAQNLSALLGHRAPGGLEEGDPLQYEPTTPQQDGFSMPAEFSPHQGCILIWPERPGSWKNGAAAARKAFRSVIAAIAESETVYVAVNPHSRPSAERMLAGMANVRLLDLDSDDAWARDVAPTFVRRAADGAVRGVNWRFNAWGGEVDGLYAHWEKDDAFAGGLLDTLGFRGYDAAPFVMEGGAVHSDGEGTLLVTEACLLSAGRNPQLTKDEIAAALCRMLGAKKILWLPRGIDGDETNEHVDNVCAFVRPGEVVLAWTDDPTDPQYACSQACLRYLEGETDARGRRIRVHKLPIPRVPVLVTQEDLEGYTFEDGEDVREAGERLAESYVNYYCANGAIVLPAFGGENAASDAQAAAILAGLFPERRIISVYAREILTGGGNIHCITQQIPEGAKL